MTIRRLVPVLAACAALFIATVSAATIPAWLDEAISAWNGAHADSTITFVTIKEPWVWYRMPAAAGLTPKDVRERIYGILDANSYVKTQDEEMVTTAKPPQPTGPGQQTKCWSRTFTRSSQKKNTTLVDRMLTTLVCEERGTWAIGFRLE